MIYALTKRRKTTKQDLSDVMVDLIENTREEGKIFVNKLSAAERQCAAAIRMYFLEEDELAVHTVASAALNLYADLMKGRGKDPAIHGQMYGLFRAARDIIEGEFSLDDFDNWGEEGLKILEEQVAFLRGHPDFDIEDMKVSGPNKFIQQYWGEKRKSYNFLKHADRDQGKLLDEAHINNENIIAEAIGNSFHLNCDMTPEKEFFFSAMFAMDILPNPPSELTLIWVLKQMSREEILSLARRNLCYPRVDDDFEIDFDTISAAATEILITEKKRKPL
jgi:hypothetical protein